MKSFCAKCGTEKHVIFDFDNIPHCQKCGDILKVQTKPEPEDFKLKAAGEERTRENTPDWYESGELMD